jgi:hypothetical protein
MSREDLIEEYLTASGAGKTHSMKSSPCPFLEGNTCGVYEGRPEACRSYPGLERPGFLSRIDDAFSNCSVCPIVYHVYERVKREIRGMNRSVRSSEPRSEQLQGDPDQPGDP